MSKPFEFSQLSQGTKILVIAVFIFLISLSVGMLVFGTNNDLFNTLNTDSLYHGSEVLHLTQ